MKIAHLTSAHPVTDTRIFHKECKTLADAGHEIVLVACHDRDEVVDGIRIRAVPAPRTRLERMFRTTWRVARVALQEHADIYHFHDPELIPAGLFFLLKGKRVIYDVHEDVSEDILLRFWIPRPARHILSKLFGLLEKFAVKRFTGVIAATPHIRDKLLPGNSKTIAIRNYPIAKELTDPGSSWNAKQRVVCYVGGISRERGIIELVDSLPQAGTRLLLAGIISEPGLYEQLKSMPGWKMVDALGFIGRDEVSKVLNRSLAGLVTLHATPKHVYALPVKMFEYMSAGIPVIASNFPLWREIIEDNQCGLCVNPTNPEEIAGAIRYIVENPEHAQEMGRNGRRAVLEKFSWETEARRLISLYESLSQ